VIRARAALFELRDRQASRRGVPAQRLDYALALRVGCAHARVIGERDSSNARLGERLAAMTHARTSLRRGPAAGPILARERARRARGDAADAQGEPCPAAREGSGAGRMLRGWVSRPSSLYASLRFPRAGATSTSTIRASTGSSSTAC